MYKKVLRKARKTIEKKLYRETSAYAHYIIYVQESAEESKKNNLKETL